MTSDTPPTTTPDRVRRRLVLRPAVRRDVPATRRPPASRRRSPTRPRVAAVPPRDGLDDRWVEAMRRHGGTPADDATWQAIVDRAEEGASPIGARSGGGRGARAWWAVAAALVVAVVGAAAVIAMGDGDDGEQVQAGPVGRRLGSARRGVGAPPRPAPVAPRRRDERVDGRGAARLRRHDVDLPAGRRLHRPRSPTSCSPTVPPSTPRRASGDRSHPCRRADARRHRSRWSATTSTCCRTVGPSGDTRINDGARDPGRRSSVADDVWTERGRAGAGAGGWYSSGDERRGRGGPRARLRRGRGAPAAGAGSRDWPLGRAPRCAAARLYDRSAVWSAPYLYVFGKELVPNPGSEEPSLVIGARVDLDDRGVGAAARLRDPRAPLRRRRRSAGEPRSGGRRRWRGQRLGPDLPQRRHLRHRDPDLARPARRSPSDDDVGWTAGVIGRPRPRSDAPAGWLFDTTTEDVDDDAGPRRGPGRGLHERAWAGEVHTAGIDAVVVGGVDWSGRTSPSCSATPGSGARDAAGGSSDEGPGASTEGDDRGGRRRRREDDRLRYFVAATVLDDGDGPELCLGGVADVAPAAVRWPADRGVGLGRRSRERSPPPARPGATSR